MTFLILYLSISLIYYGIITLYSSYNPDKANVFFAWYDIWIGVFVDTEKRYIYILLIPGLGSRLKY